MTDGEVCNTEQVVDLVKQNNFHTQVHTFGLGNGVSIEFIKDYDLAGHWHYTFITDLKEIDKKSIRSISKRLLGIFEG